ncbi:MAG: DUF4087 domain-containing protein [Tabrizicola sp.]|nr:DUF4087 domain-containing protein [Tabrizicola sp.]
MTLRPTFLAVGLLIALPAQAETERRCGWLHNPSPANYILEDADGRWWAFRQGGPFTEGFMEAEALASRNEAEWVAFNENQGYGYGCACLDGSFGPIGSEEVLSVAEMTYLPLAKCEMDPKLPSPKADG